MKKFLMAAGLAVAFLMPAGGIAVTPASAQDYYNTPDTHRDDRPRYRGPNNYRDERPRRYRHRDWRPRDDWRDERRYRRNRDVYRDRDRPRRRPGFSIEIN